MNILFKYLSLVVNCFEYFAKCLGYFLIAFVFFAISFLYTSGTFFIFPFMLKNSLLLFFSRLILLISTSNLVYNYFLCLNTRPGFANSDLNPRTLYSDLTNSDLEKGEDLNLETKFEFTQEYRESELCNLYKSQGYISQNKGLVDVANKDDINHKEIDLFIGNESTEVNIRKCNKCGALKYPRTHHCSICKKCVLNMDHHCPWIGQCVGLYNRRYFVLFLGWSFLSCLQISIFSFPMMIILINALFGNKNTNYTSSLLSDNLTFQGLLLSAMLSISFALGTGALFFFHIYLIITNQSTIEYHQNTIFKKYFENKGELWINYYDKGISNNIREIMGTTKFPLIMFSCFYK